MLSTSLMRFTAKSDIDLLKSRAGLSDALLKYKARVEESFLLQKDIA